MSMFDDPFFGSIGDFAFPDLETFADQVPAKDDSVADEMAKPKAVMLQGIKHIPRKIIGRAAMEQLLPRHMSDGECYHCFTFGKLDSMDFLNHVVRDQRLHYVAMSSWAISASALAELDDYMKRGDLGRIDFYVSDYFIKSHNGAEYAAMKAFQERHGSRIAAFLNHSKVMTCFGERYDCVIETSANANANPRNEQVTVTIGGELADWYKSIFDGMEQFNADGTPEGWEPWKRGESWGRCQSAGTPARAHRTPPGARSDPRT